MKHKILTTLLCISIVATLFSGCGSAKQEQTNTTNTEGTMSTGTEVAGTDVSETVTIETENAETEVIEYGEGTWVRTKEIDVDTSTGEEFLLYEYEYDRDARMTKSKYLVDGSVGIISYDENGNQIARNYSHGNEVYAMYEAEFDSNNNLLRETLYKNFERDSEKLYTYDENSNMLSMEVTEYGTTVRTDYEYDSEGKLIREQNNKRDIATYTEYFYDSEGRMEKWTSYYCNNNKIDQERHFLYDNNGNLITEEIYNNLLELKLSFIVTYEYDENNNLLKRTQVDDEGIISILEEYEYDAYGNCIKYTKYLESGIDKGELVTNTITKYEYTFIPQ